MLLLYICLGILAFLIIVLFVSTYVIYRMAFYNERKGKEPLIPMRGTKYSQYVRPSQDLIDSAMAIPVTEDLFIKAKDGKTLHAKYYQGKDNESFAIQFHGYKDSCIRDFCGGLQLALKLGQSVILVDERGHGQSGGRTIAFGVKEQYDVDAWIDYVNQRFHDPDIVIQGISMGAATVLLASSHDLPKNVRGIIADCPYASAKDEVLYTVSKMKLNATFFYPFIWLAAFIYGHFDLRKGEAYLAVKETKLPILLLHGKEDQMVPYESATKIQNASSLVHLESFEGAPHGLCYLVDTEKYISAVKTFYSDIGIRLKEGN